MLATHEKYPEGDVRPAPEGPGRFAGLPPALAAHGRAVDRRLAELLPRRESLSPRRAPASPRGGGLDVREAMFYALTGPGKRLRPLLTLAAGEAFGAPPKPTLDLACAVEMVHASSLILDDLPVMDDAALRRGRPAVHLAFGEASALLAAVGLLNAAYETVGRAAGCLVLERRRGVDLICALAAAVGPDGMIGGQALDLGRPAPDGRRARRRGAPEAAVPPSLAAGRSIDWVHRAKTGSLFVAACRLGALAGDAGATEAAPVIEFAEHLGLAFQIRDDLLDALGTVGELGKDVDKDRGKDVLVRSGGVEEARRLAAAHLEAAVRGLVPLGDRGRRLGEIAATLEKRIP